MTNTVELALADPAGNITAFILNGDSFNQQSREIIAQKIIKKKRLFNCAPSGFGFVEQAGFIRAPAVKDGLWRLDMAGGEFCGNAARSFGLFAAVRNGALASSSPLTVQVETSGASEALYVTVKNISTRTLSAAAGSFNIYEAGASVKIPPPVATGFIDYQGERLSVYVFYGITHVIVEKRIPGGKNQKEAFFKIKKAVEESFGKPDALGVMFTDYEEAGDNGARFTMTPAVFVYNPQTFVFESSCGSGSAALGCHIFKETKDGENKAYISQNGGVIEAAVRKEGGVVRSLCIGGKVRVLDSLKIKL
jgi:diaminopimelate epimerase